MATPRLHTRIAVLVIISILFVLPSVAWSGALPLQKVLTVRLSTLSNDGKLTQVSEVSAKTDSLCKLSFNFPDVPSSVDTPFLHIQIIDGTTILRQSIVPSPEPNGNVDIGISEVTDLQAISILKSVTISGRLTPFHLLVAQTLIRTPAISPSDADLAGAAVSAGADALYNVILTEGLSSERMAVFLKSVMKGLRASAALYRKSVDDSVQFDPKVEAYKRGEAFGGLMLSLVMAGSDASIPLEGIHTAFASAGAAAETTVEGAPGISSTAKSLIRLCLVYSIIDIGNQIMAQEHLSSFKAAGIAPPTFTSVFDRLIFLKDLTINLQRSGDGTFLAGLPLSDGITLYGAEFNLLATRDLLVIKIMMESYNGMYLDLNGDYSTIMSGIVSHMSSMGGIMAGMTPEKLLGILGKPTTTYPDPMFGPLLSASQALAITATIPTLNASELAAWSYVEQTPTFRYTPIVGLIDQLQSKPTVIPSFDLLLEPYKSLALLEFDLSLAFSLKGEELRIAEDTYLADPNNPQRWIPMLTVYQLSQKHRQRLTAISTNISNTSLKTKEAYMGLLRPLVNL